MTALLICLFFSMCSQISAHMSISSKDVGYRNACIQAITDPQHFKNFRAAPTYASAIEITNGAPFAAYLTANAASKVVEHLNDFKKLDHIGSPAIEFYPSLGSFSATTLRYITIGDEISKLFQLPENAKIVELGGGFGGQCYILSKLFSFAKYYIYDLPEVNCLIEKVLDSLKVANVNCMPTYLPLREDKIDLFISNYSFSTWDRNSQIDYLDRLIRKADRGYVIFNDISKYFGIDSLSSDEFVKLLAERGIVARVFNELVPTFEGNLLISWDKTK